MTRPATVGNRCRRRSPLAVGGLVAFATLVSIEAAGAAQSRAVEASTCPDQERVARVVSVQGTVEVLRAGSGTTWDDVRLNTPLCHGDRVRVAEHGRAAVSLNNDIIVRLDQRSAMTFVRTPQDQPSVLELCRGVLHSITRFRRGQRIITPFLNASVEGTEFTLTAYGDGPDTLTVTEGKVTVTNDAPQPATTCGPLPKPAAASRGGSAQLVTGEAAEIRQGQAPAALPGPRDSARRVRPSDAVQWALYYPPLVDYPIAAAPGAATDPLQQPDVAARVAAREEKLSAELKAALETARPPADARFYIRRAGLLLRVGRVKEAGDDLDKAVALDNRAADAYALQAVIAVVQNDKATADERAGKAVALGGAGAHLAMSYVRQAQFRIDDALTSARTAAQLEPSSAVAHARVAELELSSGNLSAGLAAAQRAADTSPDVSQAQTIAGFAYLIRLNPREAQKYFALAVELDSADPLPRLGAGLALIRRGKLEEGRKEIEIAAALDPGSAIVRSYLGKAYFEEKRDTLAQTQFDLAKNADPQDPTPSFYDAILKQTENRPVEALADIQRSTELNDNRKVYRSRLLLDQDAAARAVSTARIYNDLGFEQLALAEGLRSVNTDPASSSAHRFLADSYLTQPRRDIARVSELLQSQLLQPLSLNPLQPQLGEDKLFVLRSSGPANAGYNEYNALFTRNRMSLQLEGLTGTKGTQGDQIVLAGIRDNVAWSVGQFDYRTNRFQQDNDVKRAVENAFVQVGAGAQTSFQGEYRRSTGDRGDTIFPFDPAFSLIQRNRSENSLWRFGARHEFSPGSRLLVSAIAQQADATIEFPSLGNFFLRDLTRARSVEAQHLLTGSGFSLITGGSYYWARVESSGTFFAPTTGNQSHTNLHAYGSYAVVPGRLQLFGGLAFDDLHDLVFDRRDRVSPKLGLSYAVLPDTTIRAAHFRVMKRPLVNSQTLEPTQLAGFNQFFDDANGTVASNHALALDHKFSANTFAGVEWHRRDLNFAFNSFSGVRDTEWGETLSKAYVYWAPHRSVALSTEFHRDHLKRTTEFTGVDQTADIRTARIPIAVSLFNPLGASGLSARLAASYVHQQALVQTVFGEFVPQTNVFWVADAALSYRLPGRHGLVALEARNLFDKRIRFQDIDAANPRIAAERLVLVRLVLAY
jgi:tetratricopeptide (TPR) repeat protein